MNREKQCKESLTISCRLSLPARALEPRRVHRAMGIRTGPKLRCHELLTRSSGGALASAFAQRCALAAI